MKLEDKFCPQCGSLLEFLENSALCVCCKYQRQQKNIEVVLEKKYLHQNVVETDQEKEQRPIIDEECERCGHGKAYYSTMQMRSADEGQTVFYECCKCGFRSKVNT